MSESCDVSTSTQAKASFVLSVDIGTTIIRCHIFNRDAKIVGKASMPIELIYPHKGWIEISPERLWTAFINVCKDAIEGKIVVKIITNCIQQIKR